MRAKRGKATNDINPNNSYVSTGAAGAERARLKFVQSKFIDDPLILKLNVEFPIPSSELDGPLYMSWFPDTHHQVFEACPTKLWGN